MSEVVSLRVAFPERSFSGTVLKTNAEIESTQLKQRSNAEVSIPLHNCRQWDALATNLPAAATSDDLGFVTGTAGTNFPRITAGDVKATSSARKLGFLVGVPENFEEGQSLAIRIRGAVETTVADTSCTVDMQVYSSDGDGTSSSDLVTTSATTINSLTPVNVDFNIDTSGLVQGQLLYGVATITYVDAATATAVIPAIYGITLLADLRG